MKEEVDRICPIYEEEDRQLLFHSYLNHSSIVIYNSIKEMLKDCECVMVKQESYRHNFGNYSLLISFIYKKIELYFFNILYNFKYLKK